MISSAGANSSSVFHRPPCWIGTALISTLCWIRKPSRLRSKKAVRGAVWSACFTSSGVGQVTAARKRPSMVVPRL